MVVGVRRRLVNLARTGPALCGSLPYIVFDGAHQAVFFPTKLLLSSIPTVMYTP